MPCVPSSSLMTTGVPPTSLITSSALRGPVREGGDRQADALARQQLQRAQLVARAADGDALVQRKNALHLELPQDGEAIVRDGGADARDDGVVAGSGARCSAAPAGST